MVGDGAADSLPATVTVTVSPDIAPVFDDAVVIDQVYTVGVGITPLQLPPATGGNLPLIYSLGTTPALPQGLTFTPDTRTITGTPTAMMAQTTYTLTVTDSDGINPDTATFEFTLRINAVATVAMVTAVALTSDANDDGLAGDDNTYAIGDVIEATVTFSEEVTVNTVGGVPQLALTVGGLTPQAIFESGSGTRDLVFSYTVLAGDLDSDGVSIGADALTVPPGSSIQDADEIDAVIVHAAVDAAAEHRVDGVVATVSGIEFMTTGPYVLGDPIEVAVTFSEEVTVSGAAQLPLIVGGFPRLAAYVSNPDATTMAVFSYTAAVGDNDDDGVEVAANTLTSGAGTIRDGAGNNAELAHAAIDEAVSQLVDTVIPVLIARAVNGDVVTLTYDEALDEGSVPSTSTYTLTRASGVVPLVTDVSISGDTVTLMLSEAVMSEDVVTLSYTVGSDSDPVQDVAGNDAADFTGETVTNDTSAVITGNFGGAVTERGASTPTQTETADGMLDVAGGFVAQDGITATDLAGGQGTYGTFVLAVDGAWTYTLDNDLSVTNALAADMEVTEVFTVVSAADATVSEAVTITITGANDAPTAEAGDDRLVPQRAMETLDGTDSFDPDTDDTLTYEWVQSGGSSTVTLADMDSSVSTFTTPDVTANTTLTFTLAVTDSGGVTDAATVTITIEAGNFASAIDGPITGTVTEDAQRDTATGTLTVTDPDGGEPTFQAQSTTGTYGTFVLTTAVATSTWTYTLDNNDPDTNALAAGVSVMEAFRVQSSDNTPARVVITINGANDAPTANAGVAQTVTAGETVMLDGSGSGDPDTDDSIETYIWTQIGEPNVDLTNAAAAATTFTAPSLMIATDLIFELVVSDGAADSLPATVTVTVQPRARISDIEFSNIGPYTVGDEIEVTVTFTEVVVVSGTPRLPMMVGNAIRTATTGDSGTPVLVFSYTVIADDRDDDGVSVAMNALELNGGTIQDADGNDADLDHEAIDAVEDNRVDLVAPSVVGVAITSTGPYTEGEVIELTVTFSEVVTVETGTGTPLLPLTLETGTRDAEYTTTAPAATAVFSYTVVAGDEDDDGVAVAANALTAGGGTIPRRRRQRRGARSRGNCRGRGAAGGRGDPGSAFGGG